ncbi:MAG: uroporphyrinogen decarboxylase [Ignavibacteriaceae bacterium]|nr:uroporphyrinogen decarboxylase [Ignavibacteriaceae bacterium]
MNKLKNDLFLKACLKQKTERTPVWVMRQAGRYLPEYRAVRAKADFLTMCKTPELACEVTVQPVDLIGVDAAIIFSDILVIPEAMGMELIMEEGRGPVFPEPVRDSASAAKLKKVDPFKELNYVMEALRQTKTALDGRVPLIGFTGSPWTLLTYMVEGKGSKTFSVIKNFIYNQPKLAHELLTEISVVASAYLSAQIESGADAVQIFDTWGGILSPRDYNEFSLPYIEMVIEGVKRKKHPVIVFSKGAHFALKKLSKSGADVVGLDWTMDIKKVRKEIGSRVALQGNLDPTLLYASPERIKEEVKAVLKAYGKGTGHVFNLGHGIHPDTDPENLKAMVNFVKTESVKYHK